MRIGMAVVTVALVLLVAPAARAGDAVAWMGSVTTGPFLMGDEAAWSTSAPTRIVAASPGGAPRTLWTAPEGGCQSDVWRMAVSDTAIAASQLGTDDGLCDWPGRIVVLRPDGTSIDPPPTPDGCAGPSGFDLDGDRLAITWINCNATVITVTDLSTGRTREVRHASWPGSSPQVSLTGAYVAVTGFSNMGGFRSDVTVAELDSGRVLYGVDLGRLGSSDVPMDLAPDASLALLGTRTDPFTTGVLLRSSPVGELSDTGLLTRNTGGLTLSEGQLALNARIGGLVLARPALVDLATGTVLPVGDGTGAGAGGVAWNGSRLAWIEQPARNVAWIRNQTLEEVRAAAAARAAPAVGEPAAQAPPTAPASAPRRRCRVPRLRGSTVAVARRKLVRAGCRLGRTSGRRARTARRTVVAKQTPRAGRLRAARTRVHVTLRVSARR
jgi:hypothetical protein